MEDPNVIPPDEGLQNEDIYEVLSRGCSPLERAIIFGYYRDGLTMKQVGKNYGVSESRVSQVHNVLISKLSVKYFLKDDELF